MIQRKYEGVTLFTIFVATVGGLLLLVAVISFGSVVIDALAFNRWSLFIPSAICFAVSLILFSIRAIARIAIDSEHNTREILDRLNARHESQTVTKASDVITQSPSLEPRQA
jgi:hypothetical protein